MFGKEKDRLQAHKEFESKAQELKTKLKEAQDKDNELFTKLSEEIKATGTNELKRVWHEYTINKLIRDMMFFTDSIVNTSQTSAMLELQKGMAMARLDCINKDCKDGLVPDGVYKKSNTKESLHEEITEFQPIPNQFVCLTCGTKHVLIKK